MTATATPADARAAATSAPTVQTQARRDRVTTFMTVAIRTGARTWRPVCWLVTVFSLKNLTSFFHAKKAWHAVTLPSRNAARTAFASRDGRGRHGLGLQRSRR
jgi:hypothetical protein